MSEAPGIRGIPPPEKPPSTQEGPEGEETFTEGAHGKGTTTGDLKAYLINNYGEEEGTKFYNQFLKSIGMGMLAQVQQAAERAKEASKKMREQSEG